MHRKTLLRTVAASFLIVCLSTAQAEERGYWRAASNSARSVTGDLTVADEKLTINFSTTTISRIRALEAPEVSAVFDTDSATAGTGSLYRLNIPAAKKFVHKNSLCGAEDVHWMVAYAQGNNLQLAFFSGDKPPVFTFDAMQSSTDRCGTFAYVK
ncbi:hypothetical protein [Edaphobacter aggregans]|uniref:hypothetical protein n=1 Tax=Edaphobacter aggregans TaxID=570835 RepID=UPI00068F1AAF|nr:hypothetical protein [Edaphobacter aggregans]